MVLTFSTGPAKPQTGQTVFLAIFLSKFECPAKTNDPHCHWQPPVILQCWQGEQAVIEQKANHHQQSACAGNQPVFRFETEEGIIDWRFGLPGPVFFLRLVW